jgi:hypothetical protein
VPAVASAETLVLDTPDTAKDRFAGPVASKDALEAGVPYVATVRGTFSFFPSAVYRDRAKELCGKPTPRTIYKTKGVKNGPTLGDAAFLYAALDVKCPKSGRYLTGNAFQSSTGGKFANVVPIGKLKAPSADHRYRYALLGRGKVARWRMKDAFARDDYGRFRIVVERATAADCARAGYREWKFADEAACVAAATGTPAG